MTKSTPQSPLERFLQIMAQLRNPQGGCPWDLKQTFETLKPLLIEEAYEVSDAVEMGPAAIKEELGDLISLIGLFAQIASEQHLFSFDSILEEISDKLVRRHPHVFGDTKVSSTEEVLRNWEQIKQQEGKEKLKGLLDGVPRSLPSLLKAQQIGERCSRVGFDWTSTDGVADKIREEITEFVAETKQLAEPPQGAGALGADAGQDHKAIHTRAIEEFGDLLFTLAQYGRHLGISAEDALQQANSKFLKRFRELESLAAAKHPGKALADLGPETFDALWNESKQKSQ
jgi:MazG family protein